LGLIIFGCIYHGNCNYGDYRHQIAMFNIPKPTAECTDKFCDIADTVMLMLCLTEAKETGVLLQLNLGSFRKNY
jgi:hypothetical protein